MSKKTYKFGVYVHLKPDGTVFYVGKGGEDRAKVLIRDNRGHKAIVEKYKLDEGNFASECDSPYRVKTCPNCLDVVVYCKCSLE